MVVIVSRSKPWTLLLLTTLIINCIINSSFAADESQVGRSRREGVADEKRKREAASAEEKIREGRRHHPDLDDDDNHRRRLDINHDDDDDYDDDNDDDGDHSSDHLLDERVDNFLDDTVHLINQGGHVLSRHLSKFKDPKWSKKAGHGHVKVSPANKSAGNNINVNATGIWIGYGKAIQKIIDTFIRQSLPRVLEASYATKVSTECTGAILQMLTGLRRQEAWVMRMMDAMGRPIPAGISDGTITDFGSYDQCLGVVGPDSIVGQYCLMKWAPPLPPRPFLLTLQSKVLNFNGTRLENSFIDDLAGYAHAFYDRYGRYGICLPSTCSRDDIQQVIDTLLGQSHFYLNINHCEVKESYNFNPIQLIMLVIIFLLTLLLITGSSIEFILSYTHPKDTEKEAAIHTNKLIKFISCFSIMSNGSKLLDCKRPSTAFTSIDGIRVISMIWIILTHTYLIPLKETFAFARHFIYVVEEFSFQLILNGWVLVDTFFCIGSMLATFTILEQMKRNNGRINLIQFIFNRICRLTPNMWFTVGLMFLIPSLGSGPLWKEYFDYQGNKCSNYWYATFFYFNNWLPETKLCLLHTWYLSADMQLFILTIICFIIPLYKRPSFGVTLLVVIILSSVLGNGINTWYNNLPPTVIYNTPSESDVYIEAAQVYLPTYVHLGPYCVGVLLGYIFSRQKTRLIKINPIVNCATWLVAITAACVILMSTLDWNRGDKWSSESSAIYAGLHRTTWSIVVSWITFSCSTGNGGPINTFLSWSIFVPLSKLSYMVYLMHFLVLWMRYASIRWTLPFSHYTMICEFIINLVLSTIIAALFYLLIEAPVGRLHKLYFNNLFQYFEVNIKKSDELIKKLDSESNEDVEEVVVGHVNDAMIIETNIINGLRNLRNMTSNDNLDTTRL